MIKLGQNEKIIMIKRRHKFVLYLELAPVISYAFLNILAIVFVLFFIPYSSLEGLNKFLPFLAEINLKYLITFSLSLSFLLCWQIIFVIFTYYYLDCWIVTNERTIHTELRGFFSRFDSSVSHDKIQDITVDVHGFFPTILKYGDVHIQTAGSLGRFIFSQVGEPYQAKESILKAQENMRIQRAQHS